jgi:hypothetical protein
LENEKVTESKKETPGPKPPPVPPWKYTEKSDYANEALDYQITAPSKKKWVLLTILLLIVTNALTAGYFIAKGRGFELFPGIVTNSSQDGARSGFLPDYAGALGKANDTKRMGDLSSIGTAVNIYMAEFGPGEFPTTKKCIGTDDKCFDLASILVPDYLPKLPIDISGGSQGNTGYSFYFDFDKGFILEAIGEEGHPITITK